MQVTADQLRQLYSSLETKKLAQYLLEGGLTDEASSLLEEELRRRDSNEISIAFQAVAANQIAQKERQERERSWIGTIGTLAIAFVVLNTALWIVGIVGAPMLWTSPNDRQCQSKGYWYASVSGQSGMAECTSWIVIPIPGGKR